MLGSVQYHLCFHVSQVIFLCVPFTLPHSLLLSSPTHLPTYQRTNVPTHQTGAIVAIVIGAVAGLICIAALVYNFTKTRSEHTADGYGQLDP